MSVRAALLLAVAVLAGCAVPAAPPRPQAPGMACGPQQYPFHALQDFQRGAVVVRAQVGEAGRLEPLAIERSAFNSYLDAGAFDAVRQCRMPATLPGTPVHLVVLYEFTGENEFLPVGQVSVFPAPAQSVPP
jgi:TonB family protein